MSNMGIVIGAVIISLTIFFTFNQEEKTVQTNDSTELLEQRLEELQTKLKDLSNQNGDIVSLEKEIQQLKDKIGKNTHNKNKKEVVGTANIHTYLNSHNVKEINNSDESSTVYKEKEDLERDENNAPASTSLGYIENDDGKRLYYSVDSTVKKVSAITSSSSTNEDVLTIQDSSVNVVDSSNSMPSPPSVSIPTTEDN